jgi:hypothetical protein
MGSAADHPPVLLLLAAFSRCPAALEWARQRAEQAWGPVALASPAFDFIETDYYQATMGPELKKLFWAFERPIDPATLPEIKHQTNAWEADYAKLETDPHPRPINLDPGYLTLAKLVLASTKDYSHRIYLGQGIFAEVTLQYRHRRWQAHEFTFPDYRRADYQQFFSLCRDWLRGRASRETRA